MCEKNKGIHKYVFGFCIWSIISIFCLYMKDFFNEYE